MPGLTTIKSPCVALELEAARPDAVHRVLTIEHSGDHQTIELPTSPFRQVIELPDGEVVTLTVAELVDDGEISRKTFPAFASGEAVAFDVAELVART